MRVRRLLFGHLILNLALVLGLAQVLVLHWLLVVGRGDGLGAAAAAGLSASLVGANGLAVPALRRARRRGDWSGSVARAYSGLGVATLLLALVIALTWVLFLVLSGLLGALGADWYTAFRVTSGGVVGSVALALVWGFSFGQARVQHTRHPVRLPGLSPALAGLRVVQISDLHIGNRMQGERLSRMVARVNAAEPDVLVITGDIFDFDPSFVEDGVRRLAGLRARHGVYAILGNHDHYTGAERIAGAFARLAPGIRLLRDEIVRLPLPEPLYLAGVDDPGHDWSARGVELDALSALAAARPHDGPTLLLVHRPEVFTQAARLGFPVVLAGHTHGGQLALPTPGGHYNLARFATPLTRGFFREGDSVMYVNRGLGVGGPALRVNCPREIATLELVA